MKKVFLVFAIVIAAVSVQAQVGVGVKAGLNGYNFSGDDVEGEDFKTKFGFHAGGFVNIPVSSNFSVQPELLYSMEGATQKESGSDINFNLNYINIPVLLQFNSQSGFYAEGGPQIGFLTSAKAETSGVDVDLKEFLKGTNFSFALGAGYRLSSGLGFGARYNLGLSNISDETDSELKTGGFQIGISYKFGAKKTKKD